ncbi:MAG: hypothetical protein A2X81_02105 [Desulfobacterales bacterium GWB2_56_26]|nr:MAG: hypothetical protein A2X81_02105 [Desulfobacterales bacterium GWB2_56_26]
MAKRHGKLREWSGAVALTLVLHLAALLVPVPMLPPGSPADPDPEPPASSGMTAGRGAADVAGPTDFTKEDDENETGFAGVRLTAIPYRAHERSTSPDRGGDGPAFVPMVAMPVNLPALADAGAGFHSLSRGTAVAKLLPPRFSADTIPKRPAKDMFHLVEENAESYLLGNVFQDAVPAAASVADLTRREAAFLAELRRDIGDGRLDMPFASFIIAAEYYQLSRALLAKNLQPAFTLDEALARFRERYERVAAGLPTEIDGFAAVMILQRYAENKFYPGNGSGMVLDSLFHNLNDCEAGTKEMLAYLDELYPALALGSNRGLLQTTAGDFIGHMQVYLEPDPITRKIIANERGVVIETTRVGHDSILPYLAGETFPLEDFVARYYPEIVAGTPLAELLADRSAGGREAKESRRIVGTSDHPLKMSYGGSGTLLTAQYYDLANIRTRKIENEFLRSAIPSCDPRIDPTRIDRTNLFSNFVAIDRKLRKNLIDHYLAGLDYWDNRLMPQWQAPAFVATYGDLAGSLLGGKAGETRREEQVQPDGFLQVDAENTVARRSLESHRRFLLALRETATPDKYAGQGRQECRDRTVLDERLLNFLFATPTGPGFYFLPEPAASWPQVLADAVDDCLAVPVHGPVRSQIAALEEAAAAGEQTSFRRELYRRAIVRGLDPGPQDEPLAKRMAAAAAILTGAPGDHDATAMLAKRHSAESGPSEPSVRETALAMGRTGINSGLIWDVFDFLGKEQAQALILTYARRGDLRLSVRRAGDFIDNVVTILFDPRAAESFLAELGREEIDRQLALAAELTLARLKGRPPAEVSAIAVRYLRGQKPYRAENLLALLGYGLRKEDGIALVRGRIEAAVGGLPKLSAGGREAGADPEIFVELVELSRTIDALADLAGRQAMANGLLKSLSGDFGFEGSSRKRGSEPDFGIVFNKLSVLALLRETCGGNELQVSAESWLKKAIRFAAGQPVGKLMVGLVDKILTPEQYATSLAEIVRGQLTELARLQQGLSLPAKADDLRQAQRRVKNILGDANVLVRMLLQAEASVAAKVEGSFPTRSSYGGSSVGSVAASYLEQLHRKTAGIVTHGSGQDAYAADFYLDDRIREAMALLAFVQREEVSADRVRFRKIQDIREIKDPSKIQVIEAERKITRQDMSLLTLALNDGNKPQDIRRAWDETLAVTGGHLALAPRDGTLAAYLFAPHSPYLLDNDLGFFFSPETVEDLHNADQWGGRNDILLSSYLHFRNLPERLPDWLLRTALARSEFERQIIARFEKESFLPMILECTGDHETLPDGLFRAQWTIRKPFGEDIFPGTLLLLRMGYMTISPEGNLVFTDKYTG